MSSQRRATPAQWAALHLVDPFNDAASCILELRDRVEALEAAALGRHGKSAAAPSLVDRVACAIFSTPGNFKDEARAAIREVAAWINERELKAQNDPDCLEASTADEVVGWLRDEIAPHA